MKKSELQSWNARIGWLRRQADRAYVYDPDSDSWAVNIPCLSPRFNKLSGALYDISAHLRGVRPSNRTFARLHSIDPRLMVRMNEFLGDHHYGAVQAFDSGGRAIALRVKNRMTHENCIARIEVAHPSRQPRPVHPTVLQPRLTNQPFLPDFGDIKIEVLPEIVPLTKLPARALCDAAPDLRESFHRAVVLLGWGTNKTYPRDMFDFDAEPQNVGILPSGRIVSLDPEIVTGADAVARRRGFAGKFRALRASHLPQLYGTR